MRFWRYQHSPTLEPGARSAHHAQVVVVREGEVDELLARADGTCAFCGRPRIPAEVVEEYEAPPAADDGAEVQVCYLLPGVCACESPAEMALYIERQIGGPDADGWVLEFEARETARVWDGVVVEPIRVIRATPAQEWLAQYQAEEEDARCSST